jgi:hypothetical protein
MGSEPGRLDEGYLATAKMHGVHELLHEDVVDEFAPATTPPRTAPARRETHQSIDEPPANARVDSGVRRSSTQGSTPDLDRVFLLDAFRAASRREAAAG